MTYTKQMELKLNSDMKNKFVIFKTDIDNKSAEINTLSG